jgi:hypothetical protein
LLQLYNWDPKRKGKWQATAKRLEAFNISKGADQCRYKISNLKKTYFRNIGLRTIERQHKKFSYWTELCNVFGNKEENLIVNREGTFAHDQIEHFV